MLLVITDKTAHQGIAVRAVTQAFRVGLVGPVLQAIAVTQAHQVIMVKTGYQAIVVRVVTLATPVFLVTRAFQAILVTPVNLASQASPAYLL